MGKFGCHAVDGVDHGGLRGSRQDRVHAHAGSDMLQRGCPHKTEDGMFARHVCSKIGPPPDGRSRPHRNEAAASGGKQRGQPLLEAVERARHVDFQYTAKDIPGIVDEGSYDAGYASVANETIEATVKLDGMPDEARHVLLLRNIARNETDIGSGVQDSAAQGTQSHLVAVRQDQPPSFSGERQGCGLPDSTGSAREDGDPHGLFITSHLRGSAA